MKPEKVREDVIVSELASDPDLKEVVDVFIEELPGQLEALVAAWESASLEALRGAIHDLKGASGNAGFGPVMEKAAEVEQMVKEGKGREELERSLEALKAMCGRVTPESA